MPKKKVTTFVEEKVKKMLTELALKREVSEYQVAAECIIEGLKSVGRRMEERVGGTGGGVEQEVRGVEGRDWREILKPSSPSDILKKGRK